MQDNFATHEEPKKIAGSPKPDSVEETSGLICPRCKKPEMKYDNLLILHCNQCGYVIIGSFT